MYRRESIYKYSQLAILLGYLVVSKNLDPIIWSGIWFFDPNFAGTQSEKTNWEPDLNFYDENHIEFGLGKNKIGYSNPI